MQDKLRQLKDWIVSFLKRGIVQFFICFFAIVLCYFCLRCCFYIFFTLLFCCGVALLFWSLLLKPLPGWIDIRIFKKVIICNNIIKIIHKKLTYYITLITQIINTKLTNEFALRSALITCFILKRENAFLVAERYENSYISKYLISLSVSDTKMDFLLIITC